LIAKYKKNPAATQVNVFVIDGIASLIDDTDITARKDQVKSAIITPQANGKPPDHPFEKILAKRTTQTGPGVRNKINIANE